MERKIRFIIIGSCWRALYYVRIAKALKDRFELCALLCRTKEKADRFKVQYDIPTTTSIEECVALSPDFVVVAVDKAHIAAVSIEWIQRGFPVLSETPAAMDIETLQTLWSYHQKGCKQIVNEQYLLYPSNFARTRLLSKDLLGPRDYLYLSLAHEYHGASLLRNFLTIPCGTPFSIMAKAFPFNTRETLSRYEHFTDQRTAFKNRSLALFEFEDRKVCLYEFDSEQYRSPIRSSSFKLQGQKGELVNDTLSYLDDRNDPHVIHLCKKSRIVTNDDPNPNLNHFEEIMAIRATDETFYEAPFGLCGLSEDETAMALMMEKMYRYVTGSGEEPYPLKEALEDAYMAILLRKAIETNETITSETMVWHK